jgi:hypothetical protein
MVGYRHNGWDETPPLAEIAGHTIELLSFSINEPAIVIGAAMANRVSVPLVTDGDIDDLAREFVNSNDPAHAYRGGSIDRRIAAFLRHRDLAAVRRQRRSVQHLGQPHLDLCRPRPPVNLRMSTALPRPKSSVLTTICVDLCSGN